MRVLLLHGMGRTPASLWRLGRFLRHHGHLPVLVGYSATFERFDRIVARVHLHLATLAESGEPYAVIAHSLGGIVARAALPGIASAPARLIFLGTPARPPQLAVHLAPRFAYRWLNGEAGQLLADEHFFASLPMPDAPITTVAGTAGPQGRWSPFPAAENDWVIGADEAAMPGAENLRVPAAHTFLMNHAAVRDIIRRLLSA